MAIVHTRGFRPHVYRESDWYWPLADSLARFDALARFPTALELSALYEERNRPLAACLRFVEVPKSKRKRRGPVQVGDLYEGRIVERGEVPTRADDWHDLFNSLAFITFPRAKLALHARQYAIWRARIAPGARRLPNARTREQDALALFDEGGLCVVASPPLAASLRSSLEQDSAAAVSADLAREGVYLVPFGHALYEHMVAGLPCPLATPYVIELEEKRGDARSLLHELDRQLARALNSPSEFREPSSVRGSSLSTLSARRPDG
jgi:hypothetical protein